MGPQNVAQEIRLENPPNANRKSPTASTSGVQHLQRLSICWLIMICTFLCYNCAQYKTPNLHFLPKFFSLTYQKFSKYIFNKNFGIFWIFEKNSKSELFLLWAEFLTFKLKMFYKCQRRIILNWILYTVTNEQTVTNCDKLVILCFVSRITASDNPVFGDKKSISVNKQTISGDKNKILVFYFILKFEFGTQLYHFSWFWLV